MKLSNYSGLMKLALAENMRAPTIFTEGSGQDGLNVPPQGNEGIFPGDVQQVPPGQPGMEDPNAMPGNVQPEQDGAIPEDTQDGRAPYGQESIDVAIADSIRALSQATAGGNIDSGSILRYIVLSTRGMMPPPPPEPPPQSMTAADMMAMSQQAPGSLIGAGVQPNLGAANPDLPAEGAKPEAGKEGGKESGKPSTEKKPESKDKPADKKPEKKSEGGREIKVSVK